MKLRIRIENGENLKRILAIVIIVTLILGNTMTVKAESDNQSDWSVEVVKDLKSYNQFKAELFNNYTGNISRLDFIYLAVRVYELLDDKEIVIDPNITYWSSF